MSTFTLEILKFSKFSTEETIRALEKDVGISPEKALELVRSIPSKLQSGLDKEKAQALVRRLQSVGAKVRVIQDATGKAQIFDPLPVQSPNAPLSKPPVQNLAAPKTPEPQPKAETQKDPLDEKELRTLVEERQNRADSMIWKFAFGLSGLAVLTFFLSFATPFFARGGAFITVPYILVLAFAFIRFNRWLKGNIARDGKLVMIKVRGVSDPAKMFLKVAGLGSDFTYDFLCRHFSLRTQHFNFSWEGGEIEGGQGILSSEDVLKNDQGESFLFVNPTRPRVAHLLATKLK